MAAGDYVHPIYTLWNDTVLGLEGLDDVRKILRKAANADAHRLFSDGN